MRFTAICSMGTHTSELVALDEHGSLYVWRCVGESQGRVTYSWVPMPADDGEYVSIKGKWERV